MGICNFTLALLSLSLTAPVPASKGEPLPPGALLRLGTTRFRHANQTHTAISSDGQQVITFSTQTKSVKVWDLTTGKIIRDLSFSTKGNVYGFAWSPGGETFATLDSVPKYRSCLTFVPRFPSR